MTALDAETYLLAAGAIAATCQPAPNRDFYCVLVEKKLASEYVVCIARGPVDDNGPDYAYQLASEATPEPRWCSDFDVSDYFGEAG